MRSSSDLFPVRLISAEVHGEFYEDAYLLKPNNCPDKTVELAVTRYSQHDDTNNRVPLILLHGFFSNRLEWLPFPGVGLAGYLGNLGYDVWLPEMRGHGLSPVNKSYLDNTFSDYIQFDLPAIHQFVAEKTGKNPVWIGHNFGGLAISAAIGAGAISNEGVAGVTLLAAQVGHLHWLLNLPLAARIGAWLISRQPFLEGYKNGYGQENEPSKLVCEVVKWQTWKGWQSLKGEDYNAAVANVRCPVLAIAPDSISAEKRRCYDQFFDSLGSTDKKSETVMIVEDGVAVRKHHSLILGQKNVDMIGTKVAKWLSEKQCVLQMRDCGHSVQTDLDRTIR
ncbi:MAG: alpha/beta hydrolase [Gammaproteobacteria bacterium]|nr:MAG: alpha/beta hydrolase [Gammaproteobacteria bacterium]